MAHEVTLALFRISSAPRRTRSTSPSTVRQAAALLEEG
jgi:hypothetical protein